MSPTYRERPIFKKNQSMGGAQKEKREKKKKDSDAIT
jgi:hypothetical protein